MKRLFQEKAFTYILFIACFQIILSYAIVYEWKLGRLKADLSAYATRVAQDLTYREGKWDTTAYLSDPLTPHPSGSSGFVQPLYILSIDGFVIERSNPVTGYLDSSDTKHLLTFQRVATLDSITNERWRVQSKPIAMEGMPAGVVTAAYFNPDATSLSEIDQKIASDSSRLLGIITQGKNRELDVSAVDIRHVNYDISFEIVDRYNKVLINNGRTPSFIDRSYVIDEIHAPAYSIIRSPKTREAFLLHRRVLYANSQPVGLIVTGFRMNDVYDMLNAYLVVSLLTAVATLLPIVYLALTKLKKQIPVSVSKTAIKHISFNRSSGELKINETMLVLPYASNQYYLLDAIFAHPKKRWEHDELLEKLGEDTNDTANRTVYDTMLAVNRKAGIKLIEYKDKTYRFNPSFLIHLQSVKAR
ncbi:hypothetical protein HYS00_00320 [Candidatus Microgenomates bacterium]|nr:hypothetical protein [Candidatus Microgenomates bacterium]